MQTLSIDKLPPPLDDFSNLEAKIWRDTGTNLIQKRKLTVDNLIHLKNLVFWESRKVTLQENLNGNFTMEQITMLEGGRVKLLPQVLLMNYKAVQDEINDLRSEFNLSAESLQYISNTPLIPDEVYQNLPELFKNCCDSILKPRDRDAFFLHSLPILAHHVNNVSIEHADGLLNPSMKLFLVSQDGSLSFYGRKSREILKVLERQILEGNASLKKPSFSEIKSPETVAKYIEANGGKILIVEKGRSNFKANSFFGTQIYGELIEHSFNLKPVRLSKATDEYIVATPLVCASLNGRLEDLGAAIAKFGYGHAYNYLIYLHDEQGSWKSTRPSQESRQLSENIRYLSAEMYQLHRLTSKRNNSVEVTLNESQWELIDDTFKEKSDLINDLGLSTSMGLMVRNASVYTLKLVSLFRGMRFSGRNDDLLKQSTLGAGNEDVTAALWVVDTLLKHAVRVYQNIPVMQNEDSRGDRYQRYYNLLPILFDTAEALDIASNLSIPQRTANRYLNNYFEQKQLRKLKKGVYYKTG
ncbi:MAG: DUF3987 domain-containing protein [Balneolia bacterium]|nr:DUF3987 domain-containing protein [Balneolia bacterium]